MRMSSIPSKITGTQVTTIKMATTSRHPRDDRRDPTRTTTNGTAVMVASMMTRPVVVVRRTSGVTAVAALAVDEERVETPAVEVEDEVEAVDEMALLQGIDHSMTMLDMTADTMTEVGLPS